MNKLVSLTIVLVAFASLVGYAYAKDCDSKWINACLSDTNCGWCNDFDEIEYAGCMKRDDSTCSGEFVKNLPTQYMDDERMYYAGTMIVFVGMGLAASLSVIAITVGCCAGLLS